MSEVMKFASTDPEALELGTQKAVTSSVSLG